MKKYVYLILFLLIGITVGNRAFNIIRKWQDKRCVFTLSYTHNEGWGQLWYKI